MIEETLDITTGEGAMETFVCRPERGGPYPPVFFLMDAPGIREELRDMTRRLATVGYCMLLPNLYYRFGRDTIYGPDVLEHGSAEHTRMRAVRTKMTIPPVMEDIAALLRFTGSRDRREARPGRLPRLLHERPLCARRRRALSRTHRRGGIVLRHVARERRGREPAPRSRQGQGRALHRLRRARRLGPPADGRGAAPPFPGARVPRASSSSIPACTTASPSPRAASTTSRPPSATGSA